jgi:ubiquitin-activating enzyme E1
MVEKTNNSGIDLDLHSRAIGTMGLETLTKLIKLNVLIIGMRGLGVEVAKNLILAGPKSVTILDPTLVKIEDLSSNFFLTEAHVGKISRGEACSSQL